MRSSGRPVGPKRRQSLRILLLQNRSATPTSPSNPSRTATANGHAESNGAAYKPAPIELGGGTKVSFSVSADSPSCADCGSIMVRNGSCYKCLNCGSTSGCS